jgi:hypothetical protein
MSRPRLAGDERSETVTRQPVTIQIGSVQEPEPEHMAVRPSWNCRVCDDPWPCATAKTALTEEYQSFPSLLFLFLVSTYQEARETFGYSDRPADLFERFVGWAQGWQR